MVCLLQVNQKRPELARMNAEEEEEPGKKSEAEMCVSLSAALYNAALHLARGGGFHCCCSDALWWQPFPQLIVNRLTCKTMIFIHIRNVSPEALPFAAMQLLKLSCTTAAAIMMTCSAIAGPGGWSGGGGPTLTLSSLAPTTGRPKSCASG